MSNIMGLAKYNGCLIPDTDDDGVNDEEDSVQMNRAFRSYMVALV